MTNTFLLTILTPFGRYFSGQVEFLEVRNDKYSLGILPHHADLISTVSICKMKIREGGMDNFYACGGGIIQIENGNVTLILNSVESKNEIDVERAKSAKQRAQDRLDNKNEQIDIARAKAALARAINRINLIEDN